jgi:hypothetical protein
MIRIVRHKMRLANASFWPRAAARDAAVALNIA